MYCYFKPRVTKLGQVPTQGLVWFFTISCCNTLHVTSINFTMHSKCLSMGTVSDAISSDWPKWTSCSFHVQNGKFIVYVLLLTLSTVVLLCLYFLFLIHRLLHTVVALMQLW